MTYTNIDDLVKDKYYLIYYRDRTYNRWANVQEDRYYIVKFVNKINMYKFRGRYRSTCIFEYLTGEQKGSIDTELECFELTETEFETHVLMEYI